MTKRTAILFFAKNPLADEKMLRFPRYLAPAFRGAFGILHARTASLLKQTGRSVFHSSEANQTGSYFGMRITTALAEVFEKGYESVLVVGNDSPDLSRNDLENAIARLEAGHNVLGPSTDGGAYLIGVQKNFFRAEEWEDLPWCTTQLFQSLQEVLFKAGTTQPDLLRKLTDLDHAESIRRWLKRPTHKILKSLVAFLRALISFAPMAELFRESPFIARSVRFSKGLRAPPLFA
ncbi:MAG: DUF2064 domain-containing protein [Saprospiraceae bacterium]